MSTLLPTYRQSAAPKPRPRLRIVAVPSDKWGYADLQRVIDVLEPDERIVSVYPVETVEIYRGGHKHKLEALVEVVETPPSPTHPGPSSPQVD